jgi:hypothetical protein
LYIASGQSHIPLKKEDIKTLFILNSSKLEFKAYFFSLIPFFILISLFAENFDFHIPNI